MNDLKNKYSRTDLAAEGSQIPDSSQDGTKYEEENYVTCTVARLHVTNDNGAKSVGKPIGRYVTVGFRQYQDFTDTERESLIKTVSEEINRLSQSMCPEGIRGVLVAGLGNRNITSDSLGPLCSDNVNITRHINASESEGRYFPEISAIAPGVLAQTGIETVELIRGAAESCKPSLVIVIDALASRSVGRLASTVQLSDTGISPGSGIGNHRKQINSETIGFPVMAIGVPTVVDSATLVIDALERAGIEDLPDSLIPVLEEGMSFFVTLKDSDIAVLELSKIIFESLNTFFAFLGNQTTLS
ncbi:MAG: GPR endopeptidase [Ruminococcaceae bacterium]|nr:GPR endopeptidase [Oscillospiraceae bacterium]